jgi:hypothetical protein
MRTTSAASPRRLHWQAAFTTKPYKAQTSSLVVWQHVFVSDTPMTNWCGSSLLLTRVVKKNPSAQNVVRVPTEDIGASTKRLAAAEPRRIARFDSKQNSKNFSSHHLESCADKTK